MQIKRASSTVVNYENNQIRITNFIANNACSCNIEGIAILARLTEWQNIETILNHDKYSAISIAEQIIKFIEHKIIIVKDTEVAILDEKYAVDWPWGIIAGYYHFSIRNTKFLEGSQQREAIRSRRKKKPEPQAYISNDIFKKQIALEKPDFSDPLFAIMKNRRSLREFDTKCITISQLGDCLYAAKGVSDWARDPDFGTLPLAMTPSGGARNPYELYVYAKKVENLPQGFYHYCGISHDLGLVQQTDIEIAPMLANQLWTNDAAAVVFMVANFERSAWKYHLPPAYRIVLIEAGFIGQNISLAATRHGLSAIPTGAVSEDKIEALLEITSIKQAQILAMVLGVPAYSPNNLTGFK